MVDNLFVVSMISRRNRAVVVKVAFVVGVLYLMGMLKVARDTPSKEEERMEANARNIDPEDQSGKRPEIEEPNFEPPKLEPPILEFPDGNEIHANKSEEENEKKRLEELNEKEKEEKRLEEKEEKRLQEKEEEKAEDKELDLVVAPPKRPEGPGEMGKPYKVGKKTT